MEGNISMENKELNTNSLINRFFSVVRQAENIIFKDKRRGVFSERDTSTWSTLRMVLYKLSTPYLLFQEKESFVYLIFGFFIYVMSFVTLFLAQQFAWSPSVNISSIYKIFIGVFLFLTAWSYMEFLRDNRYSLMAKFGLSFVLIVLCLIQSFSLFAIGKIHVIPIGQLVKVNFFVGAGFTPWFIVIIYTLVSVVWSYIILVKYTEVIQNPLTEQAIRQLLEVDLGENNDVKWRLLDLSKDEIAYLRKWAETNLSNSEKRTIPTLVLSTLLGFFISTSFFREMILNLFKPESSRNNLLAFVIAILLPLIVYFLTVFSRTLLSLFKNIATQSLIIETCIVAEYAIVKDNNSKTQSKSARPSSFVEVVISFLSGWLGRH